jgi:drug/metabolite transporter (DMT)-like permease
MGLVAPVAALGVIVPVAVGVASGDRPSAVAVVGVVLGVGGATLASRAPGPASTRGLGLALVAAAGFGGFFALLAPAADHDVLWAVIAARIASVPLVLVVALLIRARLAVDRADLPRVLVAGVLDSSANLLFAAATQRGLLSVVSVLGSLYPVATVALARAVLGERMGPIQGVGVCAALVGVGLIALGAA